MIRKRYTEKILIIKFFFGGGGGLIYVFLAFDKKSQISEVNGVKIREYRGLGTKFQSRISETANTESANSEVYLYQIKITSSIFFPLFVVKQGIFCRIKMINLNIKKIRIGSRCYSC
jgi:hypothetical protein